VLVGQQGGDKKRGGAPGCGGGEGLLWVGQRFSLATKLLQRDIIRFSASPRVTLLTFHPAHEKLKCKGATTITPSPIVSFPLPVYYTVHSHYLPECVSLALPSFFSPFPFPFFLFRPPSFTFLPIFHSQKDCGFNW
jgi:hypothetical protein